MEQLNESTTDPTGSFWRTLADRGESVALIETERNRAWSYHALAKCVADVLGSTRRRGLVFLFGENDLGGIVGYLGGLLAGQVVCDVDPDSAPFRQRPSRALHTRAGFDRMSNQGVGPLK